MATGSGAGLQQQILDESIAYLLYMAERTGTLWENVGASASCNHAFASHIIKSLYRDVLGLYEIDSVNKVMHVRFPDVGLTWCEGAVPVEGGKISLAWRKEGNKNLYRLAVPAGYTLALEGNSAMWERESCPLAVLMPDAPAATAPRQNGRRTELVLRLENAITCSAAFQGGTCRAKAPRLEFPHF